MVSTGETPRARSPLDFKTENRFFLLRVVSILPSPGRSVSLSSRDVLDVRNVEIREGIDRMDDFLRLVSRWRRKWEPVGSGRVMGMRREGSGVGDGHLGHLNT